MNPEYIFFSGKGGVGKTSMACTAAVYYADNGKKTLIVTTDPASNLADVFEQPIGHHVTPITGVSNLWAMEIDPDEATREYKERSLAPMRELFDDEMLKVVEEQLSGPCTEEMAAFDKFTDFMEDDNWDVIVFDTAPTGHTLRLLQLPVEWSKHIRDSAGKRSDMHGPCRLDSGQQTEVRRCDRPTSGYGTDAVHFRDAGGADIARGDITFHRGAGGLGCGDIEDHREWAHPGG